MRKTRRRNRFLRILILPIAAVTFMIGFALSTIGEKQRRAQTKPKTVARPTVEIGAISTQEEDQIIAISSD